MWKKLNLRATLIAGALAAFLFSIPAFFYIRSSNYNLTGLLYVGSFLFMAVIAIHTLRDNKKRAENESTVALVFNSHMATITGVIISCILCLIMLVFMVPGYLEPGMADKVLTNEPANTIKDKTDGLSFDVLLAAALINFSVGSFVGIILPFYSKRNQTRDSREPTPLHQEGSK